MRLKRDKRGFVLSGTALLLVLPAMLLTATFLHMIEIGGETTSIQAVADKVADTGYDLARLIEYMDNVALPINSEALGYIGDNYRASTGLLVDLPGVLVYPIWIHNSWGRSHYAGTKYCQITKISSGKWEYSFEALDYENGDDVDWDYNEPRILVEKSGDDINITFQRYDGGSNTVVYYMYDNGTSTTVFSYVDQYGAKVGGVPDNTNTVTDATQLNVPITVRDPRDAARYSETVVLANQ